MEPKTRKFAISLPENEFKRMEQTRQDLGIARSAVMLDALRGWLRQKQERELEEKYVKGYAKKPEKTAGVEPFFRAGLASFSREDW